MAKTRSINGTTLIELMVVVIFLVALAAIAIPRISLSVTRAKINACKTNIDMLNAAIERYYATNGFYPATLADVKKDPNYFPDGQPICPITGEKYRGIDSNHRVKITEHNH